MTAVTGELLFQSFVPMSRDATRAFRNVGVEVRRFGAGVHRTLFVAANGVTVNVELDADGLDRLAVLVERARAVRT